MTRLHAALLCDPSMGELTLASLSVAWGGFLLLPMHTFATAAAYDAMAAVAPEELWGAFFVVSGVLWLRALALGYEQLEWWCALLAAGTWGFVAFNFLWSNPSNTGVVAYGFAAAIAVWTYLRLTSVLR